MFDAKKINEFVEKCPKPKFCEVPEEEWRNALLGAQEAHSEGDAENMDTDQFWSLIWSSAVYFCKGMMWAEEKAGLRESTNWPRY